MARPGCYDFDGFDPVSLERADFWLTLQTIEHTRRYTPEPNWCDLYSVREVIECPSVAFKGLRAIDDFIRRPPPHIVLPDPDGLCLAAIPKFRQIREMVKAPPPPGKTFTVFVTAGLEVYGWEWRLGEPGLLDHPVGWKKAFGSRIWQAD